MPRQYSSPRTIVWCVLLIVGALAGAAWWAWPVARRAEPPVAAPAADPIIGQSPAKPAPQLSLEQRREILGLSHRAIGLLENELWRPALEVLRDINTRLPDDLFAARNTAVALSFIAEAPAAIRPEAVPMAAVEEHVATLLRLAPQDPVSYILAARIATRCRQESLAIERYRRAVEVAPQAAVAWYELFETLRDSEGQATDLAPLRSEKKAALVRVGELQPDNLRAILDLLNLMLETRDPDLVRVLQSLEPQLPRLRRASFERFGADSVSKLYDKAMAAARQGLTAPDQATWLATTAPVRPLLNVLTPLDPVYMDLSRLRPNGLEFLLYRFQSPGWEGSEIEPADFHPAIDVQFQLAEHQLPLDVKPSGITVTDYDLDQRADLWVLTPTGVLIFGSTTAVPAWKQLAEVPLGTGFEHLLALDLDLDDTPVGGPIAATPPPSGTPPKPGAGTTICQQADADLIVYGPAGIQIWKNHVAADGGRRSWIRADKTGLEELRGVTGMTAADIDHDGDLDLAVVTADGLSIWSNREELIFKNISDQSTLPSDLKIQQIIAVDWDRDVDLDLLVFGQSVQSAVPAQGVLRNRLHGVLEWTPLEVPLTQLGASFQRAALLDADQNASWDLVALGKAGGLLSLTTTRSAGQVRPLREIRLPEVLHDGLQLLDYDNDGSLDLLTWSNQELRLHRGSLNGQLAWQTELKFPSVGAEIENCLASDIDRDGDLDLLLHTASGVKLLTNHGGNRNHWLDVRLRARTVKDNVAGGGLAAKRVNHQGLGSLIELQAGGWYQPQVVGQEVVHFGLGQRTSADLLRVVWTNGVPQGLLDVKGDWEICEVQAPKGSCPFVYTWNGERYEFFTDLLWNAPLGLQFAEGVVAPPRAWEYLKIPGERLVPQGDNYILQVTEELWEATYFDQIELLAVDHPADVEIYSNEKVGPPALAEFKIHTVRNPQPVVAARDQAGRDVLPDVGREDGQFTQGPDQILRQGLTTEHWLELDLGKLELLRIQPQAPLTLFLTGWMYPTETSISVAVSQNPNNVQARPPALWIPDAAGKWQEIRPFMGFPGGKTKTIAIDLTGVFTHDDHRLRIVTNMQFHWDHAFFSIGETPAEVSVQPLELVTADLHYRGLSRHYWRPGYGPDQYDYSSVLPGPEWPPMQGCFTRYGDVVELLTHRDDRLVVVGAGDEITLTFTPPSKPLPAGWKRDFLMHNVGWDKDADLNTLYSQTVEPLPFNAMSGYPYAASEAPAETPEYRAYLQKYQTRVQDYGRFWRRLQRPVSEVRTGRPPTPASVP